MMQPRISIVTPSYNQGAFLEETIQSVLGQDYANLEYIVLDGGSTDQSIELIKGRKDDIAHWRSGADGGQTLALIEGFQRSTGDVLSWLNADDTYLPGTLSMVGEVFAAQPDVDVVTGRAVFVDSEGSPTGDYPTRSRPFDRLPEFWRGWPIAQPATFFRRRAYDRASGLRADLNYAMDLDLFLRMASRCRFEYLDEPLATYRVHEDSKTSDWRASRIHFWLEAMRVTRPYWPPLRSPRRWYYAVSSRLHLQFAALDNKRLMGKAPSGQR